MATLYNRYGMMLASRRKQRGQALPIFWWKPGHFTGLRQRRNDDLEKKYKDGEVKTGPKSESEFMPSYATSEKSFARTNITVAESYTTSTIAEQYSTITTSRIEKNPSPMLILLKKDSIAARVTTGIHSTMTYPPLVRRPRKTGFRFTLKWGKTTSKARFSLGHKRSPDPSTMPTLQLKNFTRMNATVNVVATTKALVSKLSSIVSTCISYLVHKALPLMPPRIA